MKQGIETAPGSPNQLPELHLGLLGPFHLLIFASHQAFRVAPGADKPRAPLGSMVAPRRPWPGSNGDIRRSQNARLGGLGPHFMTLKALLRSEKQVKGPRMAT